MTRKHFNAIADAIIVARLHAETDGEVERLRVVASNIATVCKDQNSRFDRARFMAACGL